MFTEQNILRIFLERSQVAELWGRKYRIRPRLINEVFGDGGKLVAIQPIDTRPNFYYARIGSDWSTSNWDHEADVIPADWVDDVLEAARDQFGDSMSEGRENDSFPVVSADNGFSWEEEPWPEEIKNAINRIEVLKYFTDKP